MIMKGIALLEVSTGDEDHWALKKGVGYPMNLAEWGEM